MSKTKSEVMEIARKYQLEILEDSLDFNESGLDFLAVFAKDSLGNEWVLRFPRREDVAQELHYEKKILDFVNSHINFQAPKWEVFEPDLIAYKKLDGVPMGTIDHSIGTYVFEMDIENIPPIFYDSLAKVLVNLHNIPLEAASLTGFEALEIADVKADLNRRMELIKETFGVGDSLWERWQKWLNTDDLWGERTAFVHGEVHPGHVLINENQEVVGLIDWTESKVGDIATDFVVFFLLLGESGLDVLITAYERAGGYVWDKMKEHIIELAAITPLTVAEFALKSGLYEYAQMAKLMLEV